MVSAGLFRDEFVKLVYYERYFTTRHSDYTKFRQCAESKLPLPRDFWTCQHNTLYDIVIENGYHIDPDIDIHLLENYILSSEALNKDDIVDVLLTTAVFTSTFVLKILQCYKNISENNFRKLLNFELLCEDSLAICWTDEHYALILAQYGYVPSKNVILGIGYRNYTKSHIKLFHSACADFSVLNPSTFVCHPEKIRLIAEYCNVNSICSYYGNSFLHYTNDPKSWKVLVARGANINLRNNKGYTPLITLLQSNMSPEIPLAYGVDLTLLYENYQNCLFYGPLKFLPLMYTAGAVAQKCLPHKRQNRQIV